MGPLDSLKVLGESFNKFVFPAALFLMAVLTATDCWSRILNYVGLKQYGFDDDYSESQTEQGKNIINKVRLQLKEAKDARKNKSPASGNGLNFVDVEE